MKMASALFAFSVVTAVVILFATTAAKNTEFQIEPSFEIRPSEDKKTNLQADEYFYNNKQAAPHKNSQNGKPEINLEDHAGSLEAQQTEIAEFEGLSDSLPAAAENETMRPLDRFNIEPVDFYQAGDMERSYINLFSSNPLLADYALTEANCKSEYCRIIVAVTDRDQAIRLVTALSSSLLEYGKIDLQIASYGENGLAKFYIRSISTDESSGKQKGL